MVFLPGTALKMKSGMTALSEAAGQIAADYVTVYPPGIPVLVPGEAEGYDKIELGIQFTL